MTPSGGISPTRIQNWNDEVIPLLPQGIDLTFHRYYRHGNNPGAIDVSKVLSNAFSGYEEEKRYTVDNLTQGRKAWWTEYNLTDNLTGNHLVATSWLHALFTSILHLKKLEDPTNEMIIMHQITGKEPFGAIDAYFMNGDTIHNNITPLGKAIGLLHKAQNTTTMATKLDFSQNPSVSSENVSFPALNGWRFQGTDTDNLIILNSSSQQATIDVSAISDQPYQYTQLSSSQLTVLDPKSQLVQIFSAQQSTKLNAVPYSLTLVELGSQSTLSSTKQDRNSEPISIFPNPVKKEFSIHWLEPFRGSVQLLSATGKILMKEQLVYTNSKSFHLNYIQTGVYLLVINDLSGNTSVKKMVIE